MKKEMPIKKCGFYLDLTAEEKNKIQIMKDKHAINITRLLKNYINKCYADMESKKCIT